MSRSFIAQTSYLRYPCVDGARGIRAFTHAEVGVHIGVLGDRRRTKQFVREARLPDVRLDLVADHQLTLDAIPITVQDTGPYIHYPASVDDLRAVAALLPPDILLGVSAIELRLRPTWWHLAQTAAGLPIQPDPYVGRRSVQVLGGAWISPNLATYRRDTGRIYLHAYVYDPEWRDAEAVSAVLRFEMLCSFVHELAHHDDRRRRVARGRWTQDDYAQAEVYAKETAAQWETNAVLPYLLEHYPDELRRLVGWTASWDIRPDLDEALKDCPLLGTIKRLITAWGESRGHPRETPGPWPQGDQRARREHVTA